MNGKLRYCLDFRQFVFKVSNFVGTYKAVNPKQTKYKVLDLFSFLIKSRENDFDVSVDFTLSQDLSQRTSGMG